MQPEASASLMLLREMDLSLDPTPGSLQVLYRLFGAQLTCLMLLETHNIHRFIHCHVSFPKKSLANDVGPRASIPTFFNTSHDHCVMLGLGDSSALSHFTATLPSPMSI